MRTFLTALLVGALAAAVIPAQARAQQGRTIVIDLASLNPPTKLPPPPHTAAPPVSARPASPAPITPPAPAPLGPEILIVPAPPGPIYQPAQPQPAPLASLPQAAGPLPSGYNPVDCCADGSRVWLSAEYLLGWIRSQPQPPLVTNGSAVVLGGTGVNGGTRSGTRFTAGLWLDECHEAGFQVGYFFLGSQETSRAFTSNTSPQLGRPFIATTGQAAVAPLLTPGTTAGGYLVHASSDGLQGFQALFRENCFGAGQRCEASWVRLDVAFGYAYLNLREGLGVQEVHTLTNGQRATPFDSFQTRNEFHGGQVGLMGEARRWDVTLQAEALLALGASLQSASVQGSALLAQASNRGKYNREEFAVVPQLGLKAAWHVSEYVRLTAGYQVLWWTSVARPGDQIDLVVDPARGRRPAFAFRDTDVWAQGLTLGVEITY